MRVKVSVFLMLVLAGWPARATVLVPADLAELSREADVIARGRVGDARSVSAGDWRSIETVVTLEIEAVVKGTAGETIQFRVPGGQVGRYRRVFLGAPSFLPGQRVVVFLGRRGGEPLYVLGLSQGVFRLTPAAGGWLVAPSALLATGERPLAIMRGDPARGAIPLDVFEQRVRALSGARP